MGARGEPVRGPGLTNFNYPPPAGRVTGEMGGSENENISKHCSGSRLYILRGNLKKSHVRLTLFHIVLEVIGPLTSKCFSHSSPLHDPPRPMYNYVRKFWLISFNRKTEKMLLFYFSPLFHPFPHIIRVLLPLKSTVI